MAEENKQIDKKEEAKVQAPENGKKESEQKVKEEPKKTEEKKVDDKPSDSNESKKLEKKVEKPKKEFAVINAKNLPISTKHAKAICVFIKRKKVGDAIRDLQQVVLKKKSVPMKGEIPHRKGKGMMSGRFPKVASENFIKVLKSLAGNSTYNGIEDPVITEAIANIGSRPYGRFGRVRAKRTHVKIVAKQARVKKK